ncbi:MAG: glycosyltransferase family 4 protein [Anaerolineae bacterium]|nr:glycosyltransferase family 4 protein [Anaerolineae bacterium]
MKVLILSQWYPPEPAHLIQELAQQLQQLGHQVQVLTGFPNYPSGQIAKGYHLQLWLREQLEGVEVIRTWLYPNHSSSKLKRILNYLSYAFSAALLGPLLAKRPDVIFVYHPPLTIALPAWILSCLWHIPFVYQVQDMWPETLEATGMLTNQRILEWVARFAQWVYAKAAAIFVISPGFRINLIAKGVSPEKIHVVSNWVDVGAFSPQDANPELASELDLSGKFNIMFAGNMGEAQGLDTVLEAAETLQDLADLQFVLVGDGIALPRLQKQVAEHRLSNVCFLGRYPEASMPELYALADVLLVHLKDEPLFKITIPHKIFTYMASGKPILAAVAGDAADVVRDVGAGLVCASQDAAGLASAVREFYNLPAAERASMGMRGWQVVHERYSRESLVKEIEVVLKNYSRILGYGV